MDEKNVTDIELLHAKSVELYFKLIEQGVAPEQARAILPQDMITEWYWTGSLAAFARVCILRLSEDSQDETRQVAQKISNFILELFPVSWKYLLEKRMLH